jgi:hypothetical protein
VQPSPYLRVGRMDLLGVFQVGVLRLPLKLQRLQGVQSIHRFGMGRGGGGRRRSGE